MVYVAHFQNLLKEDETAEWQRSVTKTNTNEKNNFDPGQAPLICYVTYSSREPIRGVQSEKV